MTSARRPFKKPPPVSEDRLRNMALHYLARFAASEVQVLRVLERKIKRDLVRRGEGEDPAPWLKAAKSIVVALRAKGYLNDRAFAEGRARSQHEAGRPLGRIAQDLAHKGVGRETIDAVLADLADGAGGVADLKAALQFAKRRRFGPYAPGDKADPAAKRRALSAFARAGFSYDIAQRILAADDVSEIEDV